MERVCTPPVPLSPRGCWFAAFGLIQNRRKRSRRNLNSLPSRSLRHKFRRGKEFSITARFVERRPSWADGWGACRRDTANSREATQRSVLIDLLARSQGRGPPYVRARRASLGRQSVLRRFCASKATIRFLLLRGFSLALLA